MREVLPTYPEYKDSRLAWLGRIPIHWEVARNGRLFVQRNQTGFGNLPILEVSLRTGVRVRDMNNLKRKQVLSDREKYKRAAKGDIAYNMMRMWQGAVGVAPLDGLISPAYVVVCPSVEIEPRYFSYLFRTEAYKKEVDGYSRGIVKDRNRLYWEDFKSIPSCVPPPDEQKAIADYLDANAIKVRRFIRNRRRLIEVLNEQRKAIINRAVIRGIDPNVPLKLSGLDWLGNIPEHWELARPGQITFTDGDWIESPYITAEGIRLIQTGNIGIGVYREQGFRYISEETFDAFGCTPVNVGDVLICRLGDPVARACLAPNLGERMITSVDVCILKPKDDIDRRFLIYVMSDVRFLGWVKSLVRGSTRDRVSRSMLGRFRVPLPPLREQARIADRIAGETNVLEKAIERAQREISLIREYRTRLIADVVTGKVDVRHLTPPPGSEEAEELVEELEPLEAEAGELDEEALAEEVES